MRIIRMNYLGIRIAFLILVIVLCCGWSFWTLNGRRADVPSHQVTILRIVEPAFIYPEEINQTGF
jgi:hypothetical protein